MSCGELKEKFYRRNSFILPIVKVKKMYKATINDNPRLREELAEEWSSLYKRNLDILKMHCLYCNSKLVYDL